MRAEGHNTQQNDSSGGQATTSGSGGSSGGEGGAPQPKIHKHDAPEEHTHSDEVRAHNEDMAKRHDRPNEKSRDDDKVDKGFWKGDLLATFSHEFADCSQVMVVSTEIRDGR